MDPGLPFMIQFTIEAALIVVVQCNSEHKTQRGSLVEWSLQIFLCNGSWGLEVHCQIHVMGLSLNVSASSGGNRSASSQCLLRCTTSSTRVKSVSSRLPRWIGAYWWKIIVLFLQVIKPFLSSTKSESLVYLVRPETSSNGLPPEIILNFFDPRYDNASHFLNTVCMW